MPISTRGPTTRSLQLSPLPKRVLKRNGTEESFDQAKIATAVRRCLVEGLKSSGAAAEPIVDQVCRHTLNVLRSRVCDEPVSVEDVQRLVIQQLWAGGYFEAAEHYTIYRENHRKEREGQGASPEVEARIAEDCQHFPTQLQYYQFMSKFSRWREEGRRRETWREACDRVIGWLRSLPCGSSVTDEEWFGLDGALYHMEATPSLRVLQMAGPALDRCHVGVYNCAYSPIADLFAFSELLYVLMQGTGMGFSVEGEYVDRLPRVKRQRKVPVKKVVVEDTTEGWCDALHEGLQTWWDGEDVEYDLSQVRPAGARLRTKGGRASGPGPLRELLQFARGTVLRNQGGRLPDIDVHDLCCMIGKIVQVGGVRRASCISLSDLDSQAMRDCKNGNWFERAVWRTMANNSGVYEERPGAVEFMEEMLSLAKSGSGERGVFHRGGVLRALPTRRKKTKFGINPCAEIILRPLQFCNLSITVARSYDTIESLERKVLWATLFGVIQSTCTSFRYLRKGWAENCEEERLLGVDITGHADCPLLRYGAPYRAELLRHLRGKVADYRRVLAARFGIAESAADTCVKPGGDSSVLFDCASGVSPRFADYQVRWVRESVHSPVCKFLKASGVPWEVAPEDPSLVVFAFPKKSPADSTKRNDLTAVQQLENWLEWKRNWAEHSVSCTVYVEPHEWLAVAEWNYRHFEELTCVSFLPKDNGNYRYAPNEEITKEQYEGLVSKFPDLNWSKLTRYEVDDTTDSPRTFACTAGVCEL